MQNKKIEANLSMALSKIFNGLNMNALKYLMPLWISPLSGATLRCTFGAVAFWLIGCFTSKEKVPNNVKVKLILLGAFGLYGFMFFYLIGLNKTTPVSCSIFTSMEPIWVFLIMVFFFREKPTTRKILGIAVGFSGALVCILTQRSDDLASDAMMGNIFCMLCSLLYSIYLVMSHQFLNKVGSIALMKYAFLGGALMSLIVSSFMGFDAKVLIPPLEKIPFLVLMFVLIFPTTISYLLLPIGLKYLNTTVVALYGYLILIVATITSLALGQDRFNWPQTIAMIAICVSMYLVEGAERKNKATTPAAT